MGCGLLIRTDRSSPACVLCRRQIEQPADARSGWRMIIEQRRESHDAPLRQELAQPPLLPLLKLSEGGSQADRIARQLDRLKIGFRLSGP